MTRYILRRILQAIPLLLLLSVVLFVLMQNIGDPLATMGGRTVTRAEDRKRLTRQIRQDTQAVVQQQLMKVGIKVDLLNFASDTFFNGYDKQGPAATGQLDIYQFSQTSGSFPDPDISEWLCNQIPSSENPSGSNWSAVCDQDLNKLFQDQATQIDFTQRQKTFYQITKMIFDKAYWIGLWQDPDQWGYNSSKLTNVKISGVTPFYSIAEWQVKQ